MRKLYLDDRRHPMDSSWYMMPVTVRPIYREDGWNVVRSYKEFVQWILDNGLPDIISFDHDLADEHYAMAGEESYCQFKEETGYDCAKWLVDFCTYEQLPLPTCYVHSMNPVGSENIKKAIRNYQLVDMAVKNQEMGLYDDDKSSNEKTEGPDNTASG